MPGTFLLVLALLVAALVVGSFASRLRRDRRLTQPMARDRNPQSERRDSALIRIRLDELLTDRGLTLTELSERVGITVVNLSILKNGRARAIRFSTLARLCAALGCQPGDLLSYAPGPDAHPGTADR